MSTFFKHHFQPQGYNALLQLRWRMHVTYAFTFIVINPKQPLVKTAVFTKHIPLHLQSWSHVSMSHLWLGRAVCDFCSCYVISQRTWIGRPTSPKKGTPPPSTAFVWLLKYPYFWTANRLHFTTINKKIPRGLHTHGFPPFKNWRPWSMGCEWWIIY